MVSSLVIDSSAVKEVAAHVASHYPLMPLGWNNATLKVAVANVRDQDLLAEIQFVLRQPVIAVEATETEIRDAIKDHYGIGAETLERLAQDEYGAAAPPKTPRNDLEAVQEASVTRFVNQILLEAYQNQRDRHPY